MTENTDKHNRMIKRKLYIPILFLMLLMTFCNCEKDPITVLTKVRTVGHAIINGKAYVHKEKWTMTNYMPSSKFIFFNNDSIIQYYTSLYPVNGTKQTIYNLTFYLLEYQQPLMNDQIFKINFCPELIKKQIIREDTTWPMEKTARGIQKYYTNIRSTILNNHGDGAALASTNLMSSQPLEGELKIKRLSPDYKKVWGIYHLNTQQKSEFPLTISGDFEAVIRKN